MYCGHPPVTCVASPTKKYEKPFPDKSTIESTSTSFFFTYDDPYFRHNSGVTSNRKVHHPAIESLVLSLQCGKATAVFVSSRDRDFVAEVGKIWFQAVGFVFSRTVAKCFFNCSSIDEQYSYVRVLKKKKLVRCHNVFF